MDTYIRAFAEKILLIMSIKRIKTLLTLLIHHHKQTERNVYREWLESKRRMGERRTTNRQK